MKFQIIALVFALVAVHAQKKVKFFENVDKGNQEKLNVLQMWKRVNNYVQNVAISCPPKCSCPKAGMVNCSRLGLTEIPELPKSVTMLDISNNKLDDLKGGIFDGLSSLTSINFSGNVLKDQSLHHETFKGAESISTLDFGENQFYNIPQYLPKNISTLYLYGNNIKYFNSTGLTTLKKVLATQNLIESLPRNLLYDMPVLESLDVSFNRINNTGVPDHTFEGPNSLQTLNLRFNQFTEIPANLPPSLLNFDMVGNPIKVLHKHSFQKLTELQTIGLWESELETIEDFAFSGLSKLTILDLMQCHVTSQLTNHTFAGLRDIKTIDLSFSNITTIAVDAFNGLHDLQTLWLNNNPFATLPNGVFSQDKIPSISELYLWGHEFVCDCNLKWLKEMQEKNGSPIQNPFLMVCAKPEKLAGKTWDEISAESFQC